MQMSVLQDSITEAGSGEPSTVTGPSALYQVQNMARTREDLLKMHVIKPNSATKVTRRVLVSQQRRKS